MHSVSHARREQRQLFAAEAQTAVRTEADFTVTRAGVVIGCRYQRPAPAPGSEAVRIQTALLAPRRRAAAWVRSLAAGLAATVITRSTR